MKVYFKVLGVLLALLLTVGATKLQAQVFGDEESESIGISSIVMEDVIDGIKDKDQTIEINEKPPADDESSVIDEAILEDKDIEEAILEDPLFYPNPVSDYANVMFRAAFPFAYQITIVNLRQEVVFQSAHTSKPGFNKVMYDLRELQTGAYYLFFTAKDELLYKKLIFKL